MKKYSFNDHPEHKELLKPWADKWIANAMSTKPMDDIDRAEMRKAIKGLYAAAGKTPPPEHRIVFVPSPFVARFAAGFAAAIWHIRKTGFKPFTANYSATLVAALEATDAATDAAADEATYDAARDATDAATDAAADEATYAAARAATLVAALEATDAATLAAARDATYDAALEATDAATRANQQWYRVNLGRMAAVANYLGIGIFGLKCAVDSWRFYQGGNFWSAFDSFITFFRYTAKLNETHGVDYSNYEHWEKAAIHGSVRFMHADFCIVSDRPRVLKVNTRNQPHCIDGPFCEWSDGTALYAIDGVRVPGWIAETPAKDLNPIEVMKISNAEQRLVALKKMGPEKMIEALAAKPISKKKDEYVLFEIELEGSKERLLKMKNPSEDKTHFEWVAPECNTVNEALAWRRDITVFSEPVAKT